MLGALFRVFDELGLEPTVLPVARTAPTRAGYRARDDAPGEELDHGLRRCSDDGHTTLAQEEHVRARIDLAKDAVDVKRVTTELEIESLGQHDLEGVTGADVLLGDLDGSAVADSARASPHLFFGQGRPWRRRRREWFATRPLEISTHRLQVFLGAEVSPLEASIARASVAFRLDEHVVDEGYPLAPVVKGGELTNHRDDGVRMPKVIGRGRGEGFDLTDHVVAEVADEATVQGRELFELRRAEALKERVEAGQYAFIARDRAGQ